MTLSDLVLTIVAAGGGGGLVAFAAFRFLATSWLEQKFAQQLEANRHENAKELQSLIASVEGALSKTIRSQEKEFEVLSELWRLGNVAFGVTSDFTSPSQRYPDLRRESEEGIREILGQYEFRKTQIEEIITANDKQEAFINAVFWDKRRSASKAQSEFQNFLYLNEPFVEANTFEEFSCIAQGLRATISDREIAHKAGTPSSRRDANKKISDDIRPRLETLAPLLRAKFFERI